MNRLVLEINQGCPRGFAFTANQRVYDSEQNEWVEQPINLKGMKIMLQVKPSPYYSVRPFIEKIISEEDSANGFITDATAGQFQFQFSMEDTLKLPPAEYPMLIYMINQDTYTNIGGDGNNNPIFRVCHQ